MTLNKIQIEKIIKDTSKRKRKFDIKDLISETIKGERTIDLQKDRRSHIYPDRYASVIDFESGRSLAYYEEGHHDYSTHHVFLVGPKENQVRYCENLFNPCRNQREQL